MTTKGYRALDERGLIDYLAAVPALAERLGGGAAEWSAHEVGDGNLNLVFLVEGPAGGLCVKQALPYVRAAGESWPLKPIRAYYEQRCLREHGACAPGLTPELHHYDPELYLIAMERLAPHIIMRRGMIAGVRYPNFAGHIAEYMAQTLFNTSDLALPADQKRALVADFCGNFELCKITEDLIFTDPYMAARRNRWTTPQLDDIAAAFRSDADLKFAVCELKARFLSDAQALIHGDLHTGSVMVTADDTRVIDPEFAFFGPMGFDVGAVLGNLLLNYFSQDGHAAPEAPRERYQDWVLETVQAVWLGFADRFAALWDAARAGDAYSERLFERVDVAAGRAREAYIAALYRDALRFGAAKMIRRILGFAHNIDLEWIESADMRALCERRALTLARELMVNAQRFPDIAAVCAAARDARRATPD